MKIRSLEDIVDYDLCLGCGICQAIVGEDRVKIHMADDGFLRPKVLGDYAKFWETIKRVCPGVSVQHEYMSRDSSWNKLWGPVLDLKAGYATDETIRWCGSSGGAISAILCYLLESDQVDYALEIGASLSDPLDNQIYLSQNRQDVVRCAGSRYAPAAPLTNVKSLLEQDDRRMVFVGKPCDVTALKAFLRLHSEIASKVVCTITFFCTGTPSMHATEDVIAAMGADRTRVVEFKYRGKGWPGQARAVTDNNVSYEMSYRNSWGGILGKQLQFRCKICADGMGESADITCADAWYTKNGHPDFEERPGRSLILCRTHKGQDVVEGAVKTGYLVTEPFALSDIEVIQPFQAIRRRLIASRLLVMLIAGTPFPRNSGFYLIYNALQTSFKDNWQSFKGMFYKLKDKPQYKRYLVFRLYNILSRMKSAIRI